MHAQNSRTLMQLILAASSTLLVPVYPLMAQAHAPDQSVAERRVQSLLAAMTQDEKIELISGDTPFRTHAVPRLGIPAFQMTDGPVGAHIPAPTIAYAAGIGLAASWDDQLAVRVGQELGRDARSRGAVFLLGPGVNIYRAPMNGRNFEYFGEDPYLASRTAVGYIRGVQSQGVSATVKHYLGNNSEYLRHDTDSVIDERALREIYMPAFEAAVEQGHVGAIMDAYNLTNGEHMTQNHTLNVDVAKDQWHFHGIIMSDWVATYDTLAAAQGGLDLEMPFGVYFSPEKLLPLLKSGAVTQATLDDKVRRILRTAVTFGWLDHPAMDISIPRYNLQGRAAALQGALEGTVLLQNTHNALPLDRSALHTIAVIGPTAAQTVTTVGGSGEVVSFANTNLLTGISNAMEGHGDVLYARGLYTLDQMAHLTPFTVDAEGHEAGVKHETFSAAALAGTLQSTVTEQAMLQPGSTRRQPEIQEINALRMHKSQNPYRTPPTSSRWTGYYTPEQPGDYEIFVQTDGRFRLLVDDKLVFDDATLPKFILSQAVVRLEKGAHKVVLEELSSQLGSTSGIRVGIVPEKSIVDPQALAIAARSDVVVLALGFDNLSESEGGDRSFELPVGQVELIRQVAALGKKTIVAITSGGSVDVEPWKDQVQGIFATWYAGEQGGTAFARLLFGDENPSGHLPISWEKQLTDNPSYRNYYPEAGSNKVVYREGIYMGYRGYEHTKTKPLFPFGYGMSYSSYKLGQLKSTTTGAGRFDVRFSVTNTGTRAGATVAQLYVGEDNPSVDRPVKELKGFERVLLQPGESRLLTLHLDPRSFAHYDITAKSWRADAGTYHIMLGDSSENIEQEIAIQLNQQIDIPVSE